MKRIPIKLGPLALLLAVVSLCLTTLSILTFTTARADMALAERFADTVSSRLSGLLLWFVPYPGRLTIDFMRPPTADLAVTLSLALITFFMTQGFGLKAKGLKGWLKGFTEPVAFLTPINLIGEVANPVSLSFRLMGNVLAGTIIMGLYYGMLPYLTYIITPALHFYFDVFAGLLQSYIFMMLSMIYVSGAME